MGLKRNNRRSVQSSPASDLEKSNRHSLPEDSAQKRGRGLLNGVLVLATAIGLSWFFFPKLWTGGGLIGGDTYTYYFPQKVAYQEALKHGRLPHWNSWVSLGYPQLAESQTGALYPLYVLLYGLLDVNMAYNASHLLHYIAAYVFTWLLARRFGLHAVGAHLAALSFVYGWFPPRACLEWAIIGGAYFPFIIWCVESYLQSGRVRWLAISSLALGAFLVTGHFNLAFITLLLATVLMLSRLTWATQELAESLRMARAATAARFYAAVAIGFCLAAPQLLPSLELKKVSQREDGGFNQSYGKIPVWYLTQPIWPTWWYSPDIDPDQSLGAENTNRIEANFYFGVIPFYLALAGLFWSRFSDRGPDRRLTVVVVTGIAGVVLATGVLMPVLRFVPGFGYFAGPGRYGMLTALAVGLGAGRVLDGLLANGLGRALWPVIAAIAFGVTTYDLSYVHQCVTYLTFLDRSPLSLLDDTPIGMHLRESSTPVRVFAPGPNLPTMMRVNCVPEYLGIGPKQYFDKQLAIPRYPADQETPELRAALIQWLQKAGVTHVLSQQPIDAASWPVSNPMQAIDHFLNAAWGRGREPMYLDSLAGSRSRAFLENEPNGKGVAIEELRDEFVALEIESDSAQQLIVLDLPYPGWEVTIDGRPAEAGVFEGMYRSVQVPSGKHRVEWTFIPRSFYRGWIVFAAAAIGLLAWIGAEWKRSRQGS